MSFHNRTYAILDYPPAADVWPVVLEKEDTCRRSLDGALVVVKFEGVTPGPLAGATLLTHAEALAIMRTPAWSEPRPGPPE